MPLELAAAAHSHYHVYLRVLAPRWAASASACSVALASSQSRTRNALEQLCARVLHSLLRPQLSDVRALRTPPCVASQSRLGALSLPFRLRPLEPYASSLVHVAANAIRSRGN